ARLSKKSHPALFAGIDGHKDRVLGRVAIGLKRLKSGGCGLRVLTRLVLTCRRTPRCDTQARGQQTRHRRPLGSQMTHSALTGVALQVSRQAVTQLADPQVCSSPKEIEGSGEVRGNGAGLM